MTQLSGTNRTRSLVKIGGALGIAASILALAIFVVALFRLDAVFILSPLPLLLGVLGLVLTVVGAIARTHAGDEETQPISALFACASGILGGLIEVYIWMHF